jgi:hypothetical protein
MRQQIALLVFTAQPPIGKMLAKPDFIAQKVLGT